MITEQRMESYIHSLEPEHTGLLNQIERCAVEEHVPIIRRTTQCLLRFLMETRNPRNILEVGCAVGFSALLMSEHIHKDALITTIEKVPKRICRAKENFRLCGKENRIRLLEGDAQQQLEKLAGEQPEQFDFIFMDAAKGQYMNFFPDVFSLLKPQGMLLSDNVLQDGDVLESRYAVTRRDRTIHVRMREYLYELTHNEQLETVILPVGDGIAMSIKKPA